MVAAFHDDEHGGFYLAPEDAPDLIVRPKEAYDGALPAGNSVAASNLLRLARLTGETRWEELASGVFSAFAGSVANMPDAHNQLMMGLGFALGPTHEVVVAGDPYAADTRALLRGLNRAFVPEMVRLLRPAEGAEDLVALAPYAAEQAPVGGRATIYVCRDFACQAPVHTVEEALKALGVGGAEGSR